MAQFGGQLSSTSLQGYLVICYLQVTTILQCRFVIEREDPQLHALNTLLLNLGNVVSYVDFNYQNSPASILGFQVHIHSS